MTGGGRSSLLRPLGPYSLAASVRFLEGFTPAAHRGAGEHLHLAFPAPGGGAAGACVRQSDDGVLVDAFGAGDPAWATGEVERILSLDVDGTGFADVGRRDPVIGGLQQRFGGLRPVQFMSPYEAGAWALIGTRMRTAQAAALKERMARELGTAVDVHGDVRHAFPGPERLAALDGFPGLPARKAEWLRALAVAAGEGRLEAGHLRALDPGQALAELQSLPGIGLFSAELILLRGAGSPDRVPAAEPRLRRAVALAYGLDDEPPPDEVERRAEAWRPYRTWVSVLLRATLEEETGEIAGRRR